MKKRMDHHRQLGRADLAVFIYAVNCNPARSRWWKRRIQAVVAVITLLGDVALIGVVDKRARQKGGIEPRFSTIEQASGVTTSASASDWFGVIRTYHPGDRAGQLESAHAESPRRCREGEPRFPGRSGSRR